MDRLVSFSGSSFVVRSRTVIMLQSRMSAVLKLDGANAMAIMSHSIVYCWLCSFTSCWLYLSVLRNRVYGCNAASFMSASSVQVFLYYLKITGGLRRNGRGAF